MNSLCLYRINKDLKEIIRSPLEGIGIISLDNDPMKYIVNIKILNGLFEGYCLQLLLTFPDSYPIQPPRILIYPGQPFDNTYHHHIFKSGLKDENNNYFHKFCFDLLENDYLSTSSSANTGWNPSYTISTLLLQVQTFLSNPDFPNGYIPSKQKIDELMKSMDNYEKSFIIKNDNNEEIIKIHTWKNPYPEMYFKNNSYLIQTDKDLIENLEDNKSNYKQEIKENLTCFVSRLNYIDENNIILGYPIKKRKNGSLIPIPEILSYDSFIEELININKNYKFITQNDNKKEKDNNNYIFDVQRFQQIRQSIYPLLKSLIDSLFDLGKENNYSYFNRYFKSANNKFFNFWFPIYINDEYFEKNKNILLSYFNTFKYEKVKSKNLDLHNIFDIILNILSSMLKKIMKKNVSSSFLVCFFQYIHFFKKLEKKYNHNFIEYQKFYLDNHLNKLLKQKENINIIKELLELLICFLFCDNEINQEMNEALKKYIGNFISLIILKLIDKLINYPLFKKDLFMNDLRYKVVNEMVTILFREFKIIDYYDLDILYKDLRDKFVSKINIGDLVFLYLKSKEEIKQKINSILFKKLNFLDYIDIQKINSDINPLKQTNEFISVFELLRKKLFSKNFLNNLDNNFGIYLDSDHFLNNIKNKITSFNKFENYDLFSLKEIINLYYLDKTKLKHEQITFLECHHHMLMLIENYHHILIHLSIERDEEKTKQLIQKKNNKVKIDTIFAKKRFDKIYNKGTNKYLNKKNINRLFRKNHY
jgi:ubiquitin-protein ligase